MRSDEEQAWLLAFAKRLRERRAILGVSASRVCVLAKISRTTLRNLERGVQYPEKTTLEKLAPVLKVTVRALLGQDPIAASDPRIANLTDDELTLIEAFRASSGPVQQKVWGVLQERRPADPAVISAPAAEWGQRLLELRADHRHLAAQIIAAFQQFGQDLQRQSPEIAAALAETLTATETAARQLEQEQRLPPRRVGHKKS